MRTDLKEYYNWTDNRVDPNSQDFANVLAWLTSNGAPKPTWFKLMLLGRGLPGVNLPPDPLMFQFPDRPNPDDAALVMNAPGVLLMELGLQKNELQYEPPAAPAPLPPPPLPQPSNPVGDLENSLIVTANEIIPEKHLPAPGDVLGNGALYSDARGSFAKVVKPSPFGAMAYWVRTDNIPQGTSVPVEF